MTDDLLEVPDHRRVPLGRILERLRAARRVVLTTHVNADGDGCGSEAAVAAWLEGQGREVAIVNPTAFPDGLRFLLPRDGLVLEQDTPEADRALADADLVLVLDTSEPNRVAPLLGRIDAGRTVVLDHHPAGPEVVGSLAFQDPTAAAAGELVFDLLTLAGDPWPDAAVRGVYVALVSDTGSFRYANTSPRVHTIAADLLGRGVDPERVFQQLFATVPLRRLQLLREALAGLRHDAEHGISWMAIPRAAVERLGVTTEDFEGLIDHARAIQGTRVALLFRELPDGTTKLSLRSSGEADVNRVARDFGGGGHARAAGGAVDAPLATSIERVLRRVREELA